MSVNGIRLLREDHKLVAELPPPYSTVVHDHKFGPEKPESSSLKVVTPEKFNLEVPIGETLMLDKMVQLESLCSSMQSMLEFQTHAYKDVKTQLNKISKSVNRIESSKLAPKITQELDIPLLQDSPNVQLDSVDVSKNSTEESYEEDTGYDRVCYMLDHLLNDAQAAIEMKPPSAVSYSEEQDEELVSSASLITPIRQKLAEEVQEKEIDFKSEFAQHQTCIPKVEPAKKSTTEVRFWCQVITDGQAQESYQIQRKLVLPNISQHKKYSSAIDSSNTQTITESRGVVDIYNRSKTVMTMVYWTLLFALGVLLLDKYLIELASGQVANAMEEIAPGIAKELTELTDGEEEIEALQKIEYIPEHSRKKVDSCRRQSRRNSM